MSSHPCAEVVAERLDANIMSRLFLKMFLDISWRLTMVIVGLNWRPQD
jgi:hypothetical protein